MNTNLQASPQPWGARWNTGLFVLLLLPLGLLCLNSRWIFNFPGWSDQWVYFGNHESFLRKLRLFRDSYRTTRLAWDLPGAIFSALLPPIAARLTFHLTFYYAALLSFYAVARRMLGFRPALLSAVMMGGYPLFLTSMGWDYVDGACQAFFLLTLVCVLRGTEGPWRHLFLVFAGAFFAAGVYTYPLAVFYGPVALGLFLLRRAKDPQVSLPAALLLGVVGFVGLTLALCLVYLSVTRKFFFFWPSIKFTDGFIKLTDVNPIPFDWFYKASWVVLPATVCVVGMVGIVRQLPRRCYPLESQRAVLFFQASHVGLFLAFLACQQWAHLPCIWCQIYISFLTPTAFLALAAVVRPALERFSTASFVGLLAGAGLLLAAPLLPEWRPLLAPLVTPAVIWSVAAVVGGLLLATFVLETRWATIACVVAIAVAGGLDSFGFRGVFEDRGFPNRDVHLAFIQGHHYLREVWPRQTYRFWYPADDPFSKGEVYYSLAISTDIGTMVVVSNQFPTRGNFTGVSAFVLDPGTRVVVLSNEKNVVAQANTGLQPLGLTATLVAERRVEQGRVAFNMTFLEVNSTTGHAEAGKPGRPDFRP